MLCIVTQNQLETGVVEGIIESEKKKEKNLKIVFLKFLANSALKNDFSALTTKSTNLPRKAVSYLGISKFCKCQEKCAHLNF